MPQLVGHDGELPAKTADSPDPFDVLEYAASLGETIACGVEKTLRHLEVTAIARAPATPNAATVIETLRVQGAQVVRSRHRGALAQTVPHGYLDRGMVAAVAVEVELAGRFQRWLSDEAHPGPVVGLGTVNQERVAQVHVTSPAGGESFRSVL